MPPIVPVEPVETPEPIIAPPPDQTPPPASEPAPQRRRTGHRRKPAAKPAKRKPAKRRRAQASEHEPAATREEQIVATCTETPKAHADLKDRWGVLTLDYANDDEDPVTATFDPAEEPDNHAENVEVPIFGWRHKGDQIAVLSDSGRWSFRVESLADEDDEAEERPRRARRTSHLSVVK